MVARALPDDAPTFGVFALHGRKGKRLPLRRGFPTIEAAFSFANHVREERFHDPEKVIVVREGDGEIVAEPDAPRPGDAPRTPADGRDPRGR